MTVAGKVSMNVTFLSPLTPDDIRRQSVIGSYLYVSVKSLDGSTHAVNLYCDTSAGKLKPTWITIIAHQQYRMDIHP